MKLTRVTDKFCTVTMRKLDIDITRYFKYVFFKERAGDELYKMCRNVNEQIYLAISESLEYCDETNSS